MAASRAYLGADRGYRPCQTPIVLPTAGAAPVLRARATGQPPADTTHLRCGGCQADALYTQNEPGYGRLVHAFLGRHEPCGNAVKITRVRGGHN
jgi:hypothetical protein